MNDDNKVLKISCGRR